MNYEGLEEQRSAIAGLANDMCDVRTAMNKMQRRHRFDSDELAERLIRQTIVRANAMFMQAYNEILELNACFKD